MRVIAVSTLKEFWLAHHDAEQPLKSWFHEAKLASWDSPAAIKAQYRSVSILKSGRCVFNIAGNRYRLVCQVSYKHQLVFVKFIGTHEEYDQIDAQSIVLKRERND